jgi:2,6-dihydroxypseudooxynicotine hydrolase
MTSDPNVRAAIAHWAPRLIANGIDYNDFQATTARIEHWRSWCREWSRTAALHERLAEEALERGSQTSAAEAYVRAALCHHFGKFVFFEDMEANRSASAATVAAYGKALAHLDPPSERVLIPYGKAALPAYLRKPGGVARPPVVIFICGLDSVKEEMNSFEALFHRRGMATLAFDGPGQGESDALPIEPAFEKPVSAVLDWLAARGDVDGGCAGAVGVSLGGYYVARAAAFDRRLVCGVAAGGPYEFGTVLPNMPEISQQAFQVHSHSPDRQSAIERAKELTLADAAHRIAIPFAIVFGKKDRLIPFSHAQRLHAEIPHPEKRLFMFEEGNHICNNMPYAWRPMIADWMGGHLRAAPRLQAA